LYLLADLTLQYARARTPARQIGWDGDIRDGVWWTPLPAVGHDAGYVVAWAQGNNGSCFVSSPIPLPWLAEQAGRDHTHWNFAPSVPDIPVIAFPPKRINRKA
jgi:hypothetical protein